MFSVVENRFDNPGRERRLGGVVGVRANKNGAPDGSKVHNSHTVGGLVVRNPEKMEGEVSQDNVIGVDKIVNHSVHRVTTFPVNVDTGCVKKLLSELGR